MTWTSNQQIALAIVPKFSAFMSLFGSCWIVSEVLFDEHKRVGKSSNVYSRLLLGMSFFEALESIWNFQSTWPIPRGTEGVYGASGNTRTCVAQGFFLQLGLAVPMYNASLSIYYLLVIKYNFSDSKLQKRVEPYMHAIAISVPLGSAVACIALNLFNNANLWCWIAPFPLDCADSARYGEDANCVRGDNAWIYRWSFYFAPLWTCIITAVMTMAIVYKSVRATDVRSLKYRRPQVTFGETTQLPCDRIRRESNLFVELEKAEQPAVHIEIDDSVDTPQAGNCSAMDQDESSCGKSEDGKSICRSGSFGVTRSSHSASNATTYSTATSEINGTRDTSGNSRSSRSLLSISSRVKHLSKARARAIQDHHRSHDVFVQALWYTGAFLVTHLFSTVNRSLQLSIGQTFFPLLVLHSFFDPFQGFLNFLVYRRPRYIRYRRQNIPRLQAMHLALRWTGTASNSLRDSGRERRLSRMSALSFASADGPSFSREISLSELGRPQSVAEEPDEDNSVSVEADKAEPNGLTATDEVTVSVPGNPM